MKIKNIMLSTLMVIISVFLVACGSIKFDNPSEIFLYGKKYSIPVSSTVGTFVSSDENVLKIEEKKILPIGGGYSVITETNTNASMVAIITGITHSNLHLKFTTTDAQVFYGTTATLGVFITVENLSTADIPLSTTNCKSFSIYTNGGKKTESLYCRLANSPESNSEDITIKPSESVEIITYFKFNDIPVDISTSGATKNKFFNVEYLGIVIGASRVSDWKY